MATKLVTGLALMAVLTIAASTAVGQPTASEPAASPPPGESAPTSPPPSSPYAPPAAAYPPGYPAPAPGYPAPYPYPGPTPYPPGYYPYYPYPPGPPNPPAPPAPAVEEPPPPGWHTHDGFFFRFQLGPGAGVLSTSGTSALYGAFAEYIALGWAISPRIVLFAEMGGVIGVPSDSNDDDFAALATYTVRASYYFRNNLFVGGGIGGGLMGLGKGTDNRNDRSSKMGLGLRFELGQEYWVSTNWALGWALNLSFAAAVDKDASDVGWTGVGFNPAFTISYN
jgi:hypothetical protein